MRCAASLSLLVAACGGASQESEQTGGTPDTRSARPEIVIDLVAFKPDTLSVERGGAVVWVQRDAGAHTITSGTVEQSGGTVTAKPDGRFDSGEVTSGSEFEFTFTEAGTFPFFCALHPATMRGEIRVT